MNSQNPQTSISPADRRAEVEAIARQLGVAPHQLTIETAFYLGQVVAAQAVAVSETCGSGELPDRLQRRVAEREQELRRVVAEQQDT